MHLFGASLLSRMSIGGGAFWALPFFMLGEEIQSARFRSAERNREKSPFLRRTKIRYAQRDAREMEKHMNVMIVGGDKIGVRLAKALNRYGHYVAVVDRDPGKLEQLGLNFSGVTVVGIPVDQEVLQNAGIESCDALVAVTNDDNVNIMVSQMALEVFKVPRVVASIVDPSRETVFSHFGIRTICPTRLTVDTLYSVMIDEDDPRTISFDNCTVGFAVKHPDKSIRGKTLLHVPLRDNEEIFGVQKDSGEIILAAKLPPEYTIDEGDKVICCRVVD